jgi:PPOX class probable F420-dependent enzyme
MSRRAKIRLGPDEVRAFLEERKTIILCTHGAGGFPHPLAMWFILDADGAVRMTTYSKSQKVKNIERNPRVALLVETGEQYQELRGALLYGRAELIRETEAVADTLARVSARIAGTDAPEEQALGEALRAQAAKRVIIRVLPERVVSWDHRKLGGVY